ncbi:MAG: PQQ-binding-like beta-propeller repeat protein [Owenweeksia sp.]|nr:PQQ-binding-like beta-propeller repeat protein [Owenweeksia sp.]
MYLSRQAVQDENWYYFLYNHDIYKFNINTDVLTPLYTVPDHLSVWKLVKHGDKLFMSVKKKRFDNDWVGLLSVDVNTGVLDTAWAHTRTDDNIPFLVTPHIVSENGEEIVYFAIDHFQDGHPTNVSADMYCYNITKDKLLWKVDSFETQASISTTPPVVNGNTLVKIGYRTIYGFDKGNGNLLWTYHSPDSDGHFAHGFLANYGSNVLAKADNDHFVSINASSGTINYDIENTGYTPSWKYYIMDGVIFYTAVGDARFVAIRMADGERLMFHKNPPEKTINEYADITYWYAIDKESRTGFVHDYSRITAFKIPEF